MIDFHFLLFCILGGIVSVDSEAGWQVMISQPLVACPVAGWLFGNFEIGLMIGILMQLPFLIEIPAGGAKQSFSNLGAFVGAALAADLNQMIPAMPNLILFATVAFAILISWITMPLVRATRGLNLIFVRKAETALTKDRPKAVSLYNYLGVGNALIFGIFFSASFWLLGNYIMPPFLQSFTPAFEQRLDLLKMTLLGAGVGAMMWMFVTKTTIRLTILGAGIGSLILFLLKG